MSGSDTARGPIAGLKAASTSSTANPWPEAASVSAEPLTSDTAIASDRDSTLDSSPTTPRATASSAATATAIARNSRSNADAFAQNDSLALVDSINTRIPTLHIRTPSRHTPNSPLAPPFLITPGIAALSSSSDDINERLDTVLGQNDSESLSAVSITRAEPINIERSLRHTLSASSMYAGSHYSISPGSSRYDSPTLNALPDITPLPSPLPETFEILWKKSHSRPGSLGSIGRSLREEVLLDQAAELSPSSFTKMSPTRTKPKNYGGLTPSSSEGGGSSRSISEFRPGAIHNERPRNVTVGTEEDLMQIDSALHREKYLAEQRGLTGHAATVSGAIPTPPRSSRSITESEGDEVRDEAGHVEYLTVREGYSKTRRKYRTVRPLGQGTFSKVVLATNEKISPSKHLDEASETWLDPRYLVAIKIVQHGPAGGADADRIDLGLRREIDILKTLRHPTLIQLRAFDWNEHEALIVLNYCAGGDLFDLASQHRPLLTPLVVQRMFAELVDALRYLHSLWIVHRDIKLENVLVNPTPTALGEIEDPLSYPYPLITLTDLGLSREVPKPPESPMLTTRCGSEDYAAPEILLGQPYDGRQTDVWALGVLTYALVEGRLPFDLPPPRPGLRINRRGRTTHRIARCDWIWAEYGDNDGDWDPIKGADWEGAREVIDGLLKKVSRGRLTLDQLATMPYVQNAIPPGGLTRPPHADDEEE